MPHPCDHVEFDDFGAVAASPGLARKALSGFNGVRDLAEVMGAAPLIDDLHALTGRTIWSCVPCQTEIFAAPRRRERR